MSIFEEFGADMDVLFEENLSTEQSFAYDNIFYQSPTYSSDSGVDLFLPQLPDEYDHELTEIVSPLMKLSDKASTVSAADAASLDHSYSTRTDIVSVGTSATDNKTISAVDDNKTVKEESGNNIVKEDIYKIKLNFPKAQLSKNYLNFSSGDENFKYTDEDGKVVVVDKSRKNAEMAKLNRKRKKRYVNNLESEIKSLRVRNNKLMANKSQSDSTIKSLQHEVKYLRSVLENKTMLSSLVKAVSSIPSIDLSLNVKDISSPNDVKLSQNRTKVRLTSEKIPGKRGGPLLELDDDDVYNGGVCLHVSKNKVAIEFCAQCNKK